MSRVSNTLVTKVVHLEIREMPGSTISFVRSGVKHFDSSSATDNSPELFPGDRIVYENVGGYTMSLNPLFIQYFPAVYIKRNDSLIQVRRKWTPED